jgi:hypothetical protein
MNDIRNRLDNQTRELEALRRTCSPETSSDVSASSKIATVPLDDSRPLLPERRKGKGRGLLRFGSKEAGPCPKDAVQSVLIVTGSGKELTVKAASKLLQENPPCGGCVATALLPAAGFINDKNQANVAGVDVLKSLHACLHQQENVCNESSGLSTIAALVPFAALSNRSSIIQLLGLVEAGIILQCPACIPARSPVAHCTIQLWHAHRESVAAARGRLQLLLARDSRARRRL